MNENNPLHLPPKMPLATARRIHETCRRFEAAWSRSSRPRLEASLADTLEPERSWLFAELLALEIELRRELGEQPTEAEYRRSFLNPGDRQIIETAFKNRAQCEGEPLPAMDVRQNGFNKTKSGLSPNRTAEAAASTAGQPKVEGYEILDVLGRGGMGVVYKARDIRLKRLVALKMILTGEHAGAEDRARFRAEAELVARLQHPHIVQIFDIGEQGGHPYIAFEFIEGQTLAAFAGREPQPPRLAAELVEAVARAMHVAHQQGVVHRDLKPGNIMLAGVGSADPKITDFGLAKDLSADREQTTSGSILGTPQYMSPEQAEGRVRVIGPASDIYSMGAILYALLTGQPPFHGTTPIETLKLVVGTEPVAPTQFQTHVPTDLDTICLKCIRKDPARRYQTAGALADDLRRFLNGEPILARPVGSIERAIKWVKRNPAITGAAVAVMLALTAGATVSYLKYRDAERQRLIAEAGQREAEKQTRLAENRLTEADNERETALAVSEFLGGLFEDVDPVARTGRTFGVQKRGEGVLTALEVVNRGTLKLKTALCDKPRVRAALLDRIGTVYLDLERATEAEPLLQESLQLRLVEFGPDSLEVAASRQSIGLLHMGRAEMEPASAELKQALALRRKHLGNDHPLVADTLFHLGVQLCSLNDFANAEPCLRECLAIRRRHFGSESREVGAALFVIGEMYIFFDEAPKAVASLMEAAALAEKIEGKNDFMAVISLFTQAQLADKLGSVSRARTLYTEAETKAAKLLGNDHHIMALGRSEFAEFLFRQNEYEKGMAMLRDAIAILRKSFGPDSAPLATRLLVLARAERHLGHGKEAEAAAHEAAGIWRKSLAGKTPSPLNAVLCLHVQAALVFERGALAEAAPLYREGLAILLKVNEPSFAERQHNMASSLAEMLLELEGGRINNEFLSHTKPSGKPALDLAHAETWAKASQAVLRYFQPPTADNQLICDHFQTQAILMLRSAVSAGLKNADAIASDPAFKPLLGRADFREIVQSRR